MKKQYLHTYHSLQGFDVYKVYWNLLHLVNVILICSSRKPTLPSTFSEKTVKKVKVHNSIDLAGRKGRFHKNIL